MRTRPEMTPEQVEAEILALPTFAERLDWLMTHVVRPDFADDAVPAPGSRRSPHYSASRVAGEIGTTQAYISKLRAGINTNPGIEVVRRLARLFGVDPGLLVPPLGVVETPGVETPGNDRDRTRAVLRLAARLPEQDRTAAVLRLAARLNRMPDTAAVALDRLLTEFMEVDRAAGQPEAGRGSAGLTTP